MLTGSDSAPAKANEAKQKNEIGSARDQVYLLASNAQTEAYERVYVKGKQATSDADVTAGNASKNVSDYVKTILKNEYPEDGTKKVGLATIVATDNGATITISTTDWKQEGNVAETGGTLTWKDLTQNLPTQAVTPLEIGDSVNYSTSLNGVTLNNWKVFYNEKIEGTDYTYLIYGDYLPILAINSDMQSTYDLATESYFSYIVYQNNAIREPLIAAMSTTSNWADLIYNGKINETELSAEVKNNPNVWAMGSPTLDLWVNSWNAKYPSDALYTKNVGTDDIDNNHFYATGYGISDTTPVTSAYVDLSSKTGYGNTLYFPRQESASDGCRGYFVSTPSTSWENETVVIEYYGCVGNGVSDDSDTAYAFRPVIKLPTSALN